MVKVGETWRPELDFRRKSAYEWTELEAPSAGAFIDDREELEGAFIDTRIRKFHGHRMRIYCQGTLNREQIQQLASELIEWLAETAPKGAV